MVPFNIFSFIFYVWIDWKIKEKSICMILFNLNNESAQEISKKFHKGLLNIINNGQYKNILEKYQGKAVYTAKYIQDIKKLLQSGF